MNDMAYYCLFVRLTSIFSFLSAVSCSSQPSICVWIALLETAKLHMKDRIASLSAIDRCGYWTRGCDGTVHNSLGVGVEVGVGRVELTESVWFSGFHMRRVKISLNLGKFSGVACYTARSAVVYIAALSITYVF